MPGQEHTVTVPVPDDVADPVRFIGEQFEQLHRQHYGHSLDDPVEVTTFRLSAVGVVDKPQLPHAERRSTGAPAAIGTREMVVADGTGRRRRRSSASKLLAGDELDGPAVIVEHTATTVIHAGDRLVVGGHGELIITLGRCGMIDPITVEVIRHGLISACEEMARNLCRTSYNTVVYEIHDYGIGVCTTPTATSSPTPRASPSSRAATTTASRRSIEFLGADNDEAGRRVHPQLPVLVVGAHPRPAGVRADPRRRCS